MNRLQNVSLIRLVAILLIFIFHCFVGMYVNPILAQRLFPLFVGVQIFLFISGFLYAGKRIDNFKQFFVKQFTKILLPYYVFLLCVLIFMLFYAPATVTFLEIVKGIFCLYPFFDNVSGLNHFWFLPIIIACYACLPFLQSIFDVDTNNKKRNSNIIIIVVICMIECVLAAVMNFPIVFSCFFVGYWFRKNIALISKSKSKTTLYSALIFVACSFLYYLFRGGALTNILSIYLDNLIVKVLIALIGISFSIAFLNIFEFINKYKSIKFLEIADKFSFDFYIVHHVFLIGSTSVFLLNINPILASIIAFALSIISSVGLYYFTNVVKNILFKKTKNIVKQSS